ncbi:GrpB family protein [Nonomuraea sp. NPDC046802]|uniref:GrpB family protein n=1 Tax=Nonomuraea sp. NPDC046802 TaxID=3154919 RepID=UPI0033EA84D2
MIEEGGNRAGEPAACAEGRHLMTSTPEQENRATEIKRVPMTEAEIEAAHVGQAPRLDGKIELADYDPAWPVLYGREADRIRGALGPSVLLLEHVGSTSVPELPAKPILDVLLVVADSADEPAYAPPLEAAGFRLAIREPDWYEHRVFRRPESDMAVTLHVLSEGCPEIERMLLFRDRLRADDADRRLYERTKRELAGRDWKQMQNYADAKTEVVEAIIARATLGR